MFHDCSPANHSRNTALKIKYNSNSFIAFPSLFSGYEHFWIIMFYSECLVSAHYLIFFNSQVPCQITSAVLLHWAGTPAWHKLRNDPPVALPLPAPTLRVPTRITRIKAGNQKTITDISRAPFSSSVVTRNIKIFTVKCLTKQPQRLYRHFSNT